MKMTLVKPGNIEVIQVGGVDIIDYPDFVDAYVSEARFISGENLLDEELDYLNDQYPELAQELAIEYI